MLKTPNKYQPNPAPRKSYEDILNKDPLQLLKPETELEFELLHQKSFLKGLEWGLPRFGHPEGKVLLHVRDVLDNVEKLDVSKKERQTLRLISLVHDTFKYKEEKSSPRDWSKHHGVLARHFTEQFSDDKGLLDVVELHDEAYHIWCLENYHNEPKMAKRRLENLYRRMGDNIQLFYLFFKSDTKTGDKNQKPLHWFEATIKGIDLVHF